MYPKFHNARLDDERGQTTIALAGVLAVGCLAAVALSLIGQAVVHRARARNAADAVALAAAVDPAAAEVLHDWYGARSITIEQLAERTIARSGPSQAAAWASTAPPSMQPAPALVAIIARAEQLQETTLAPVAWDGTTVTLSTMDAAQLREIARELGVCEIASEPGTTTFVLC